MHGWSLFNFETVCEAENDQLDDLEIHYISKYNSFEDGLNSTPGGKQYSSMLVPEVKAKRMATMRIPDVKKRWLLAITAAQRNPEQRALLSKLCKERCQDSSHMQKRADGIQRYLDTLSDAGRKWYIDRMRTPEATSKRVKSLKAKLATPIGKKTHGDATARSWKDPESREKRMAGLKKAAEKRRSTATEKKCNACAIVKPVTDFYRGGKCKKCINARIIANRRRNGSICGQRTVTTFQQRANAQEDAVLHAQQGHNSANDKHDSMSDDDHYTDDDEASTHTSEIKPGSQYAASCAHNSDWDSEDDYDW
tara:strand:+ start:686 stop:1612 length:927 start_codon:yes stop_codon:yes gene_type:complete